MKQLILLITLVTLQGCATDGSYADYDVSPIQGLVNNWAQPANQSYAPQKRLDGACYSQCLAMGSTYPYCKAQCSY
jgi:hypothetical protein